MITLKLKYQSDCPELISQYIRQYNHVYRVAFNSINEGNPLSYKDLTRLNNISLLDSWFIQSARSEASYLYAKVKKTDNKKVIFGGKKNFRLRCQGKISKEEFQAKRLVPLCSIGEKISSTKPVKGNRKFKLNAELNELKFKLKDRKITLTLLPYSSSYKQTLAKVYEHQLLGDVPITYKLDTQYVYITLDESVVLKIKETKKISNRVLGIDLNPNYIGWSIVDWKSESEFEVIQSGVYSFKELNDKEFSLKGQHIPSSDSKRIYLNNKRKHEIFEVAKNLIDKALYYKVESFAVEELSITSKDNQKGKRFNSQVNHQWLRDDFINNLSKRCNIFRIRFQKVKAEYSSFIGNFLYRSLNLPDPALASIEISRRGYEFISQYIKKSKKPKKNIVQPDMIKFNRLIAKSLEEFSLKDEFDSLTEIYYILKKSKQTYRLSVSHWDYQFSRLFSPRSKVKHLGFYDKKNILI